MAVGEPDENEGSAPPREHLLGLLEAAPFAIMEVDISGRVKYWNRAAEDLYGWTAAEVIGQPLPTGVGPSDAGVERERFTEQILAGQPLSNLVTERTRKDGARIVISGAAAPLFDAEGNVTSVIAIGTDITEQSRMQGNVLQAQRMDAVGRLAGGVAHDFNNLLTAILGSVEFLLEEIEDPTLREDLESIRRAASRGAGLTGQLLAVGRRQLLELQVIDLNEVVLAMKPVLRRLLRDDITLVARTAPESSSVHVDPAQLEQVFLNLAVNAKDAMPRGGRLFINVDNVEVPGEDGPDLPPGPYVRLVVRDTGTGMDPETLAHAFEPFFTTKRAGEGAGLGLSAVYGIVNQSGGQISVASDPGHGTTFVIHLPRGSAEPSAGTDDALAVDTITPPGTILLVEDDAAVRGVCRQVLEGAGYRVIEASDGHGALAEARELDGSLDLVVSDIVLPGIDGIELASLLAEERTGLRVLLISGFSDQLSLDQLPEGAIAEFLAKPFSPAELLRRVRALAAGG